MIRWRIRWNLSWVDPRRKVGEWWKTYSTQYTARSLLGLLNKEEVAVCVLESVQSVKDTGRWEDGFRVLHIQLRLPVDRVQRYMFDMCLSELGLGLIEPVFMNRR